MTSTTQLPTTTTVSTNGNGHHTNGRNNPMPDDWPVDMPRRRTSVFPFLLDLGLVLIGFGFIIVRPLFNELGGNGLMLAGAVLAVVALIGWLREARADYKKLKD
jgi:hypothetical protein